MSVFKSEPQIRLATDAQKASYAVNVEESLLEKVGELLSSCGVTGRAAVISDETVAGLYAEKLQAVLREAGYESELFTVPPGEASKSMEKAQELYVWLAEKTFSHSDFVICLGGGTVGDLAGFVAATYMRGLRLFSIPTTLIAQVDSALGGKNGINFAGAKNLIGSFYQAEQVFVDSALLDTLPEREMNSGMAEVVKYSLLALPSLWELFCAERKPNLLPIITATCRVKMMLVDKDPYDRGIRRSLNFGHTLGHCYESLGSFAGLSHGEAVAVGMVRELQIGEKLGLAEAGLAEKLQAVLTFFGLPAEPPVFAAEELRKYLVLDKKQSGGKIQLALVARPGEPVFHTLSVDELLELI